MFDGAAGVAVELSVPDLPAARQTLCHWLLTAPFSHPLWSQYLLAVVRLDDDAPGFPPPKRKFIGATHELLVVALDPEHGPYDEVRMERYWHSGQLPFLVPVNIAEQFEASDEEMRQLARAAAWGVTSGALEPETSDAPERIRLAWLQSLTKTLAHRRSEEHAP